MSAENESEYLKQFTGSAGANLMFFIAFMLYRALQTKCKNSKSKCATHCGWCDLEIENDDSSSDNEEDKIKHENTRKGLPKVYESNHRKLPEGHQEAVSIDIREIREPAEVRRLAHDLSPQTKIRKTNTYEKAIPQRFSFEGLENV